MMTDAEQRERMLYDMYERGEMPALQEVAALIEDAEIADHAEEILEAIYKAVQQEGYVLVDVETDDTNGPAFMMIREE